MAERCAPDAKPEGVERASRGREPHTETDTSRASSPLRRHVGPPHPLLGLQRSVGNAAVASMLAGRRPATRPAEKPEGILQAPPFEVAGPPTELSSEHVVPAEVAAAGGADAAAPPGVDPDEPGFRSVDGLDLLDAPEPVDGPGDDHHDPVLAPDVESSLGGEDHPVAQRLSLSDLPGAGLVRGAVDAVGDLAGEALGAAKGKIASLTGALRSGWGAVQATAGSALSGLGDQIRGGVAAVGRLGSSISAGISQGFAGATRTMGTLTSGFTRTMSRGLGTVKSAAGSLGRALTAMDADGLRAAYGAITATVGRVFGSLTAAAKAVTAQGQALWDGLTGRLDKALGNLGTFASGLVGRLQAAAAGALAQVNGLWGRLRGTASSIDGVGGTLARAAAAVIDRLLAGLRSLWDGISSAWNAVQRSLSTVSASVTAKLSAAREVIERQARSLLDRFRGAWKSVTDRAAALTRDALGGVSSFVGRFAGLSLDKVITQVSGISRLLKWISSARAEAEAALDARATQIAAMIDGGMPQAAREQVVQHMPGGAGRGPATGQAPSGSGPAPVLQRLETGPGPVRSSLGFGDALSRVWTATVNKWKALSAKQVVLDMLKTMLWPWPAVGHEFVALWADWKSAANRLFAPRTDSVGTFFQDLWTDLLTLPDFILAVLRHVVNMVGALMGWVTIILTVGGAVFLGLVGSIFGPEGTVVGAIAGGAAGFAVAGAGGLAVLALFVSLQGTDLVRRLAGLVTGNLTPAEQKEDVDRCSDIAIALGVAIIIAALAWIASQIAGGFLEFVRKTKTAVPEEAPPPETPGGKKAGDAPKEQPPATPARPVRSNGQPVSDAAMEVLNKATADRQAIFRRLPDFLERFAKLAVDDQAFLNGISDPALEAFGNLSEALQDRFLNLSKHVFTPKDGRGPIRFRDNYNALPSGRQVALLTEAEIAAGERTAAMDTSYENENAVTKQGHGFGEHGAFRSDAELFARAKAMNKPVSRYNSSAQQEAQAAKFRRILEDPNTPAGDDSPINKNGRKAIQKGTKTAQQILNDRPNNMEFLKSKVTYKERPAGEVIGTEFDPDGVTTRPVDQATVVFELDKNGNYQIVTNFPEL